MHKAWSFSALAMVAVVTSAAPALADETGVEVGVRSGYGIPLGDLGDGKYKDFIAGNIPLWVDLGYRVTPNVMVGGYFMYGFGFAPDSTDSLCNLQAGNQKADCSVHNMRLGAQVHYHFRPWEDVDPWIGAGLGYEWTTFSASAGDLDFSLTGKGFEFFNLQRGVDFMTSHDSYFAIGPFVALSVASISSYSCSVPDQLNGVVGSCGGSVASSTHEWLTLGVRITGVP